MTTARLLSNLSFVLINVIIGSNASARMRHQRSQKILKSEILISIFYCFLCLSKPLYVWDTL